MSALRKALEDRANSGHGVLTHTELREILAAFPEEEERCCCGVCGL